MTTDKLKNPANMFPEWKKTEFVVWDKEKKENVSLPMPLEFSVIKVCTTIKGYNKIFGNIYSNEVDNVSKEALNIRYFAKEGETKPDIGTGMWMSLKDDVKKIGGRYCATVYAMYKGDMICLCLMGSALAAFIQAKDGMVLTESVIEVSLGEPVKITVDKKDDDNNVVMKDGKPVQEEITYTPPKMEYLRNLEGDEYDKRDELELELKKYHRNYQEKNAVVQEEKPKSKVDDIPPVTYESDIKPEDLPF